MSLIADTLILEQIKEMRAEHAQFRQEVMAELAALRRALDEKPAVATQAVKAKPAVVPNRLPRFMTAPPMGERQ